MNVTIQGFVLSEVQLKSALVKRGWEVNRTFVTQGFDTLSHASGARSFVPIDSGKAPDAPTGTWLVAENRFQTYAEWFLRRMRLASLAACTAEDVACIEILTTAAGQVVDDGARTTCPLKICDGSGVLFDVSGYHGGVEVDGPCQCSAQPATEVP